MELRNFTTEQLEAELQKRKLEYAKRHDLDCEDYEEGTPAGRCNGMGHYLCDKCCYRSAESIRQQHEDYLYRSFNPDPKAKFIKAKVIETGEIVMVDDRDIKGIYNMWHYDRKRNVWHDNELVFMEPRLQTRK